MYARLVSLVAVRVPSRRCLAQLQAAAHLSSSVSAGAPVSSSPHLRASLSAPLAPLRMLSFQRRRPLSTQSSGGGSGTVVDALAGGDQAEQIRKIAEVIRQRIAKETEELKRTYGSEQPDKVWMFEFYKHRAFKLLPAAAALATAEQRMLMPSVKTKSVVFFAHALATVPAEAFPAVSSTFPVALNDSAFILAVLRHIDTPAGKNAFQRFAAAIKRGGSEGLRDAGAHITAIPMVPVHEWPFPFEVSDLHETYRTSLFPWEVTEAFKVAKTELGIHDYLMLASTTVLESLWAAFYATGEKRYVRRITELAQQWAAFSDDIPDHTDFWVNLEKKLPEALTKQSAKPTAAEAARSCRVQMSRIAIWSLIAHSRRHQLVIEALSEEIGALSNSFVEVSARDAGRPPTYTEAQVRERMEVLPTILSLIARVSLDAPLEGAAATPAATLA